MQKWFISFVFLLQENSCNIKPAEDNEGRVLVKY